MNYKNSIFLVTLVCMQLCGCENKPKDNAEYITQCIALPANNSRPTMFETFINGNKLKCHPLLWRVPHQYSPEKLGIASADPVAQHFKIKIADPELIKQLNLHSLSTDIQFEYSWGTFDYMRNTSAFNEIKAIWELKKVESIYNGLDMYVSDESIRENHLNLLFFVTQQPWIYTVSCFYTGSYKSIPMDSLCWVESNVDGRVYAKYAIYYSQVGEIEKIALSIATFAKGLMLN